MERPISAVARLLESPPALHVVGGRLSSRWKLQNPDLQYIASTVEPGMRTVETGAGLSTIVFALVGAHHTCIAPDSALMERISRYCGEQGLDTGSIRFVADPSEQVLPGLDLAPLDFALIDGRHGFPAPFIDAYYMARALRIGGRMMIDDLKIWTSDLLVRFLQSESSWTMVRETWDTAVFEKRSDDALAGEWIDQPFVVRRSLRRSLRAKVGLVRRMFRTGDWTPVRRAIGTGDRPT